MHFTPFYISNADFYSVNYIKLTYNDNKKIRHLFIILYYIIYNII